MALPVDPFLVQNTVFSGNTLIVLTLNSVSGYTASTDTITKTAHGLSVGSTLKYVSGTGFSGLTANTMYYVVAVPTADTFKLSATSGGSAISVGTSSAGVFKPVQIFGSKLLTSKLEQEEKKLERADSAGVLRAVRKVLVKQQESFTFEVQEVKRLLPIFGNGLAGRITATATLYCPDPDDVSGKCALVSEADFSCTVTRDGDLAIGNSEFSTATFNLESNKLGVITWTPDATV